MTTRSNYGGFGDIDLNTVQTNKGTKSVPKKCAKCDNTVTNEEKCPQCFSLTEGAKLILND